MISSHVKISPLLWLHNKPYPFRPKNYLSKMVWHFIDVYIINRTLHGRLEIRNFSSRVEKYFTSEIFFQHAKRNFVSPCGHVISSICGFLPRKYLPRPPALKTKTHLYCRNKEGIVLTHPHCSSQGEMVCALKLIHEQMTIY